jgi:hypothetical protein
MKAASALLAFVAVGVVMVAMGDTETMMEGTTELLQEAAHEGAKAKEGLQEAAKGGEKMTMKIWGKEVSMAQVNAAKKQLGHVVTTMSVKRPELMSSISAIQELTAHPDMLGEGKLNGGFKKLRKVLWKIDSLEQELFDEWEMLRQQYEAAKKKCDDAWNDSEEKLNDQIEEYERLKKSTREHRNGIEADKAGIAASELKETGTWALRLAESKDETTGGYDKYWLESDDRAAVRNILMQAVWLVCYGFRKFRHDEFCETLRKEPDFAETGIAEPEAKGVKWENDMKTSYAFSETMEEVWKQQKAADAHAVNREDGDPDMEKGFVNNRAPWGVDPPVVEGEATTQTSEQSLIEEAVGVDSKEVESDGTMTSQALAARLDFLVQSSSMPEKAMAPVQDLIEALQEDDSAQQEQAEMAAAKAKKSDEVGKLGEDEGEVPWWKKQWAKYDADDKKKKTLVMIMVDIEKEQGTLQHEADIEWMATIKITRDAQMSDSVGLNQETVIQNDYGESIKKHNEEINSISKVDEGIKKSIDDLTIAMHDEMEICQVEWMDIDVQREANEEEQVNIKRLNSLLRFLALGDVPVCEEMSGEEEPCNMARDRGTCTWWTRGMSEGGSGSSDEKDRAFCACEWGFYGENCEKIKCPGLGRVLYKDEDPGVCSNRGGKCDDDYCEQNGCNSDTGKCAECHPKYHGFGAKVSKCQFMYCPMAHSSEGGGHGADAGEGYILPKGEGDLEMQCAKHGQCDKRTGKCACDADFWGDHCGWKKCPGATSEGGAAVEAKFAGWSASACNNRGECMTREIDGELVGQCKCDESLNFGKACEYHKCGSGGEGTPCQGRGACKKETGMCMCDSPWHGARCEGGEGSKKNCFSCTYQNCKADCGGGDGVCNKIAGKCTCIAQPGEFFNGALCKKACRSMTYSSDWSRSFDKWGWSTCKDDNLLIGLKRDGAGDALYNLAFGKCARPCEGGASDKNYLRLEHCYHENWWKKFDFKGGKLCRKNYFVAGLFRSHCNSLYCLEMAKCCQVQRSVWNECKWVDIQGSFSDQNCVAKGETMECSWAEVSDERAFVAGFYRSEVHTLNGLTYLRQCVPYFFGALCRPGESGAHCEDR